MPAYPEMGRTVVDGSVYVDGVPLADTWFARDPLNPVRDGRVLSLLEPGCECVVFDGQCRGDVIQAAQEILATGSFRIVAGPAAIAAALAASLGTPSEIAWPAVRRCLVVNGSCHEVSRKQIQSALESLGISTENDASWHLFRREIPNGADPLQVAIDTGREVRSLLSERDFDALLVFGGDTAFGILESFGLPPLRPIGEILPGMPLSSIDGRREVLITKAGGFGPPDIVARLRSKFNDSGR